MLISQYKIKSFFKKGRKEEIRENPTENAVEFCKSAQGTQALTESLPWEKKKKESLPWGSVPPGCVCTTSCVSRVPIQLAWDPQVSPSAYMQLLPSHPISTQMCQTWVLKQKWLYTIAPKYVSQTLMIYTLLPDKIHKFCS